MAVKMNPSSGNVFRDVRFGPEEAEHLRLRSKLAAVVLKLIRSPKVTQVAAAQLLGVTQPRVSDLVRGRIELFSIDGLVTMLAHAGIQVELVVKRRRSTAPLHRVDTGPRAR